MIRPVLYVNLPGIVRAFERRARARQGDYAHFVVAPELDEARSGLAALLSAILPITPNALTWIVEDHWRLLGLAQARIRPGAQAWDLTYLAALTSGETAQAAQAALPSHEGRPGGQAAPSAPHPDDILMGLLQYALNAAIGRGAQRFFARVGSDAPELAIFSKLGFQRYAIETTYALDSAAAGLAALDDYDARPRQTTEGLEQRPRHESNKLQEPHEPSAGRTAPHGDTLRSVSSHECRERTPDTYRVEDALHQHSLALAATSALAAPATPGERAPGATMAGVLLRTWQGGAARNAASSTLLGFTMTSGERDADDGSAAPEQSVAPATVGDRAGAANEPGVIRPETPLRPWRRRDAWGLLRLYDACTPRLVQVAESLTSEEFVFTRAAGGRTWYMPLLEPPTAAFVYDRGDRLGGWLRIRHGRGAEPHLLALLAHPDDDGVAIALVRFALRIFAREAPRPIICMTRGYESEVANALRRAGFAPHDEHALWVRHLTVRVAWSREVPAFDSRMVYGVKGFGTAPTRLSGLSKGGKERLCLTSSTTISTPCSPCYPHASERPSWPSRNGATSSKSSSTLGVSPKVDSPRAKSF